MALDLFLFLIGILILMFCGLIIFFVFKWLVKGALGAIMVLILLGAGIALSIAILFSFRDSITSDYRCVDTLDTYPVYNMSFEGNDTVVHYINSNNEIVHIKSDKTKIFYDLAEDREPYAVRNQYWRWFLYWEEIEVHIKE